MASHSPDFKEALPQSGFDSRSGLNDDAIVPVSEIMRRPPGHCAARIRPVAWQMRDGQGGVPLKTLEKDQKSTTGTDVSEHCGDSRAFITLLKFYRVIMSRGVSSL